MIRIDQALRFAPGMRLTFSSIAAGALIEQAGRMHPSFQYWWELLRDAVLRVDGVGADSCRICVLCNEALGRIEIVREHDGSLTAQAELTIADEEPLTWQRGQLTLMLGGKRDVYLAQRTEEGDRLLLKVKYTEQGALVSIMRDAFAHRLTDALRSFLPGEIKVGTLAPHSQTPAVA
jgi:hypothetical protein